MVQRRLNLICMWLCRGGGSWRVCYGAQELESDVHLIVQKRLILMRMWLCWRGWTWCACDCVEEVEPEGCVMVQRRLKLMCMWMCRGGWTWCACDFAEEVEPEESVMVQRRLNLMSVLWYKRTFFFSVCVHVFVVFKFLQYNLILNQSLLLSSDIVFFHLCIERKHIFLSTKDCFTSFLSRWYSVEELHSV